MMSEWKDHKLGELVEFTTGKLNSNAAEEDGKYPFFTCASNPSRINTYAFDTECILLAGNNANGIYPIFHYKGKFNAYQRTYVITRKQKNINYVYLFNVIKLLLDYLQHASYGSVTRFLTLTILRDLPVKLPPIEEQQAIAAVLSSLDDKIDLLHRQNKTLESLAQTLFRHWFIDGAEDDWEERPLVEFIDFKEGPGIRNWQYVEDDDGINFINIRLIQDGEINLQTANKISREEAFGKYAHFLLEERDMIVSTSGTLGRSAIVRTYHLPLCLNTSVIRFRPVDGIHYSFMYQYLQSDEFLSQLMTMASGSVQLNFGPTHLKRITMAIPPIDKLGEFSDLADPLYQKVNTNYLQIRTLENLRDTLLPKLMSGEVRVRL